MGLISRVSSRTYRFKKNHQKMVKSINCVESVSLEDFGSDVKLIVKGQHITVIGPRGTLKKDLSHLKVEIKKTGPQTAQITKWWGTKRGAAALKTAASLVRNMAIGVTSGFRYKMRTVFAHFPINMVIENGGKSVNIKNFLGEKKLRRVDMLEGVSIKASPKQKDEFWLEGNDLEKVSQTCSLIYQKAIPRNKDIRKFLDGIYVSEKTQILKDNELLGI